MPETAYFSRSYAHGFCWSAYTGASHEYPSQIKNDRQQLVADIQAVATPVPVGQTSSRGTQIAKDHGEAVDDEWNCSSEDEPVFAKVLVATHKHRK
jgi:hypothetical protein